MKYSAKLFSKKLPPDFHGKLTPLVHHRGNSEKPLEFRIRRGRVADPQDKAVTRGDLPEEVLHVLFERLFGHAVFQQDHGECRRKWSLFL